MQKKRGALSNGGVVDYDKVYNIIINDLKNGNLGNITLDGFIGVHMTKEEILKKLNMSGIR